MGSADKNVEFSVPTLWGRHAFDWFKAGERAVVFALSMPLISQGNLGRMPLSIRDGEAQIAAYTNQEDFFQPVQGFVEENEIVYANWGLVRELLLLPLSNESIEM